MKPKSAFEQALAMLQSLLAQDVDPQQGATPQILDRLEGLINLRLPQELRELLSRNDGGIALLAKGEALFLPCALILDEWSARREAAASAAMDFGPGPHFRAPKGVKSLLWSERWIPFCKQGDTVYCIDLDPDYGGVMGQVLGVNWVEGSIKLSGKEITSFLEKQFPTRGRV